ncbi:DUF1697 domain-containing protein [Pontibacter fetidus]|uniref:DUF1697 domain-containing protein n=1 Tax=Pontibacter fetidus TaxID=2700082 RepID=A0A6B2H8K0_9BACT|nr:DUF1697 domain-containing protein [Pontibacter fetidus]NDK56370.1 DUF1697 domain-containing protein [Pontibacter fetidus]
MPRYISILRGINVSGHRMIKMNALKELCSSLGFQNVQTYIQSGNIVYQHKEGSTNELSHTLKTAIEQSFGFDVPVITFTLDELTKIVNANPFLKDSSNQAEYFHVTFLSGKPEDSAFEEIKVGDYKNDKLELIGEAMYLYCPDSYSNSKLTNSFFEKKLKVSATTRNWKTTNELLRIANSITV